VIIAGTVVLCLLLYLFFRHTRLGIAMQARRRTSLPLLHGHSGKARVLAGVGDLG
jgi:hypothetical protein